MPYIAINTNQHISDEKADKLQQEIGRIVTILPGKNIDNTITQINGDRKIFVSGKAVNATFCEVRMFGPSPGDKKKEFSGELNKLITEELGEQYKLYINIQEYPEWGNGPEYLET